MNHDHSHNHHHGTDLSHIGKRFIIGIFLNLAFVIVEFIAGIHYNSLALLSDAGHNLSDVASLSLALFAYKISRAKTSSRYTYGFHKSTILVSLINAVFLLIAVGSIGWEAIQRFFQVTETSGNVISYVAAFGIGINALSALLFFRDKEKDLNVKAAYLHLAIDALVSLGVVIGGILISYTGYSWIDPLISLMIIIVIALSTWRILSESLRLSLDAVPSHIDIEKIIQTVNSNPQVKAIHHIHIWAMSTTKNAMTAHLVLENNLSDHEISAIKHALKSKLAELNIQHITFETESENCSEEFC